MEFRWFYQFWKVKIGLGEFSELDLELRGFEVQSWKIELKFDQSLILVNILSSGALIGFLIVPLVPRGSLALERALI